MEPENQAESGMPANDECNSNALLVLPLLPTPLFSKYGPGPGGASLRQMAVSRDRERGPPPVPMAFSVYRDPLLAEAHDLPCGHSSVGWDGEARMQFAAPVVWR